MRRLALLIVAAAIAAPSFAHVTQGRDDSDCKTWTAARPKKAAVLEAWMMGYVSGLAQAADFDVPDAYPRATIVAWVDRYCKANPGRPLGLAGFMLFSEIRQHHETKR